MDLNALRSMIISLDSAYERIESEHGASSNAEPWSSFFYQGAEPGQSPPTAGIASDALSSAFTQEMNGWVRLAQHSETARDLLGIERFEGGVLGADTLAGLSSVAGEGVDLQLAGPRDLIVPKEGSSLWDAGVARGTPMAMSGTWLEEMKIAEGEGLWAAPGDATKFGMKDWASGRDALVGKLSDADKAQYAAAGKELQGFLRGEGSKTRREVRPVEAPTASAPAVRGVAPVVPPATPPGGAPPTTLEGKHPVEGRPAAGTSPPSAKGPARLEQGPSANGPTRLPDPGSAGTGPSLGGARGPVTPGAGNVAAARGPIKGPARGNMADFEGIRDTFAEAAIAATTGPREGLPGGGAARAERVHVRVAIEGIDTSQVEVREIHGKEAISRLFAFDLLIVCPADLELPVDDVLGASATILFERGPLPARSVYGMIAEIVDRQESESEWRSYRLHIVPRAWRSTLVTTQEVYLDTNVPDLILKKLGLVGLDDAEMRIRGTYPVRELVVQYKESDLTFISRLAEHVGICFFFDHDGGTDKLVFADESSAFRPIERGSLPFRKRGDRVDVFELETRARAFPARYAEQDYNYRTPTVDLTGIFDEPTGFGGGSVEYGAHYRVPAEGTTFARLRAEEQVVTNRYSVGRSDAAELIPGYTFTLTGHPRLDGQELLVVEVEHHAVQATKLQTTGAESYENVFRAVDASLPYRPARTTKRPRIAGVLTAVVEPDASGHVAESAVLDEEGRYTVLFYFDAADVAGRPKHSRPVRMIQAHSGPNYGIHFPLKPGIEVLITFMDGDPDRPLILGSVPNPITPTPVNKEVNLMNRIETTSGLIIEMRDAVPPLAK